MAGTQPDWMEAIRPNPDFVESCEDFTFDDGGPEYNWNSPSYEYPIDLDIKWTKCLEQKSMNCDDSVLDLPDVATDNLNDEQRLAFDIVMERLLNHKSGKEVDPLRLIVTGTAGTGKSFLIKCLVKAIRVLYNSNTSVQVLCPTGNSANIISGVTIHSFLKIPIYNRGKDMKTP